MMDNLTLTDILDTLSTNEADMMKVSVKHQNLDIKIYYYQSTVSPKHLNDYYLNKITKENFKSLNEAIPGVFYRVLVFSLNEISYLLSNGNLIMVVNDEYPYYLNLSTIPVRSTEKGELDPNNLLASQDDFVENINHSLALIRKRIKSPDLIVNKYKLGNTSQTDIYFIYLEKTKKQPFIKEIECRLNAFKEESLTNINDLNTIFNDSLLLPTVFNTGSPDYAVGAILEGKAILLMDNSPVVAVLPTTLSTFTTIKNESNEPKYYTFFARLFTIFFFFISIFFLGLVIALTNFNPTFFSTLFMSSMQITERGTTFPIFIECLIVLFLFETFRLISSRAPNNYVQNIIIIFSGLFIGQNAISSGLVGSTLLLIASLSYVSSFAITNNQHLITSFDIFRLYNLILSYTFGILGFTIGLITTLLYLSSQKSVGVPFFLPFSPLRPNKLKGFFFPKHGDKNE